VALKGFLWYQGEHNAARPADYAALFTPFIHGWRARFDAPSAPFYFVQLPNFSISDDWVGLRAAQATALALPATGMAVAIDIGNDNNIHPGNKRDVGLRLARLARHHDYGETALEYSGPVPGNVVAAGSQLVIAFDHAAGLHLDTTKNRPGLPAFEIAAATGAFFPATPALEGRILRLFAPEVPAPHRARYAWHNTPSTPLYNAAGLPAAPFSVEAGLSPSNLAPPGDQTAAPGQQITLRADIAGDATAAFIRWQVSIDGVNWRDIDADSGLYTGETTAALVIKAATAGMDGLLFRYLAGTTADNAIPSPTATLSVALALLQEPKSLVADQTGDLYVAEAGRIWRVRPGGGAYVFSPPAVAGGSDGAVYGTPFFNLAAIALHSGTLYAANAGGDKIDTVSTSGSVTTFTGAVGFPGSTDGPLAVARFNYPSGLAFAPDGTLYVADTANRAIRKIHPNGGGVTTLAGIAADSPVGLAVSQNGDRLYVADAGAHVIRSVSSFGWDTAVLAGDAGSAGCAEGAPGQARFDSPRDLLIAGDDTLYVVDTGNSRVLEILPDGSSRTIVGSPEGETGFRDGSGTSARFDHPGGITMDSSANLYIADTGNGVLRRISPADEVTTLLLSQTTPPAGENNNSDDSDSDSGGGGGGGGGAPGAWFFFAGAVVATMRIACRRAAVKIKN
jgi:sugar lactone lactonase YvrE